LPNPGLSGQAAGNRRRSLIVEAHSVNHCTILRIAKYARTFIPWLWKCGDGSYLHVAETECLDRWPGGGVFVEPRGQPDGIGELQAERLDWFGQFRRQSIRAGQQLTKRCEFREDRQRTDGKLVRVLRLKGEQTPANNLLVKPTHVRRRLKTKVQKASVAKTLKGEPRMIFPKQMTIHVHRQPCAFLCLFFQTPLARCAKNHTPFSKWLKQLQLSTGP
jgi:hypothetical protein